jgi:hypothetical protein
MNKRAVVFSTSAAFKFGWRSVRSDTRTVVVLGLLTLLGSLMTNASGAQHAAETRLIFPLLTFLVQTASSLVYLRWALAMHDGSPFDLKNWPEHLRGYLRFVLAGLLVCLGVALGMLLLIVPGVLFALRYGFASLLTVDRGLEPLAALRESARITRDLKLPLLGFAALAMLLNMAGALALGMGAVVTVPWSCAAAVYVLRRLQEHAGPVPLEHVDTPVELAAGSHSV